MKSLIVILGIILSYNSFGQVTLKDTVGILRYYSSYKAETKYDTIQAIGVKYNWDFDSYAWVGGNSYGYESPLVSYTPMRVIVEVTKYGKLPVKSFKRQVKQEPFESGTSLSFSTKREYEWIEFKPKFDQIIYQNE